MNWETAARVVRFSAGVAAALLAIWALMLFVLAPTLTVSESEIGSDSPEAVAGVLTREYEIPCASVAHAGWPQDRDGHPPEWDGSVDARATEDNGVRDLVDRVEGAADQDNIEQDSWALVRQALTQRCDQRRTAYVAGMALLAPGSLALFMVCVYPRRTDRSDR